MNTNTENINTTNHANTHAGTEDTSVSIIVDGKPVCYEFDTLNTFHKGDSWFGCAVGFRAMQIAARELSASTLWSRDKLSIISGHPGAGVKDAIELVSGTISTNHFQLLDNIAAQGCNTLTGRQPGGLPHCADQTKRHGIAG